MYKTFIRVATATICILAMVTCGDKSSDQQETILEGRITIGVDETFLPLLEDQEAIFESEYNAQLTLAPKSEAALINSLVKDSLDVVLLSRKLSDSEMQLFNNKKIYPKVTHFATDGVALLRNAANKDTVIALADVARFLKGESVDGIKGLVFDNPNSSSVRLLKEKLSLSQLPEAGIYSFANNIEAIKYVAENDGMVGVVGLNWITQPSPAMNQYMTKISVLSVKGLDAKEYVAPTQDALAQKKYPLARDLFIVNCQGTSGLGMGFGSFISGEKGQRIVLKSGLLPVRIPGRKIIIRNNITKENSNN